jgi:hypothetical protein
MGSPACEAGVRSPREPGSARGSGGGADPQIRWWPAQLHAARSPRAASARSFWQPSSPQPSNDLPTGSRAEHGMRDALRVTPLDPLVRARYYLRRWNQTDPIVSTARRRRPDKERAARGCGCGVRGRGVATFRGHLGVR